MHQRAKVQKLMVIIHEKQPVAWKDLFEYVVPSLYTQRAGLYLTVMSLEKNGYVTIERKQMEVNQRILSVSVTPDGNRRWIKGIRDDIQDRPPVPERKPHPRVIRRGPYSKRIDDLQPIAADPQKPPPDMMPCMVRIRKCEHGGCYLRFRCRVHPEYIDLDT